MLKLMEILPFVQLLISASIPILVAYFGWNFGKDLKRIEHLQWQNRIIVERRLRLYDELSPILNSMLCFCTWVGDWKDISPDSMIKMKRTTDKQINVYRHLLSENLFKAYDLFIHDVFQTFNGPGQDARIKAQIYGPDGDRTVDCHYEWDDRWGSLFDEQKAVRKDKLRAHYSALMNEFRTCLGLDSSAIK